MPYLDAIRSNSHLVNSLGEGNAHLVWTMGLYLEEPDLDALASDALTDGPDDHKIDFLYLDRDAGRIIFAQGLYGSSARDSAPANKASDLNTAAAWLFSSKIDEVPARLQTVIRDCRQALDDGEAETIELLYVHNYPESVNVAKELRTAALHVRQAIGTDARVSVSARELGQSTIENLFSTRESHIEVLDDVSCPTIPLMQVDGPNWKASVLSVPGQWLHSLYSQHGEALFSANYRGFLGMNRRKRINTGIRQSAESRPNDFWVFNNGITLLTQGSRVEDDATILTGVSIINGAQTTGSIGSVDTSKGTLDDVKVLCRIIQCSDPDTIAEIVKFNNTQNQITTWDQYSNDHEQHRLESEFKDLGYTYARKRGFRTKPDEIGIEEVAQPLLAFHGKWSDANRGKNAVFDRKPLYKNAFENKKARHILLVYSLARAVDDRRMTLKTRSSNGEIIAAEDQQLALLRGFRFKNFLVSVTARCLETIVGKKLEPEQVAFSPSSAKLSANSLYALIAAWSPVVDAILALVATTIDPITFADRAGEDGLLDDIAAKASGMLYATKASEQHRDFAAMISDS